MPSVAPCLPACGSVLPPVQVPGSPGLNGLPGPTGATGPAGPAGTANLVTASSYNATGNHVLANTTTVQAVGPIFDGTGLPSVQLPNLGKNYMLFARARIDGSALDMTAGQTLTIYLFSLTAGSQIPNSQAVVEWVVTGANLTGTFFIINTPVTFYTAQFVNEVIKLYGVVSAVTNNGSVVCVEAAIEAVQIS